MGIDRIQVGSTETDSPRAWLEKHKAAAEDQPGGLYILKEDIVQRHNFAARNTPKVAQLKARPKEIRQGNHTAPRFD